MRVYSDRPIPWTDKSSSSDRNPSLESLSATMALAIRGPTPGIAVRPSSDSRLRDMGRPRVTLKNAVISLTEALIPFADRSISTLAPGQEKISSGVGRPSGAAGHPWTVRKDLSSNALRKRYTPGNGTSPANSTGIPSHGAGSPGGRRSDHRTTPWTPRMKAARRR